MESSQELRIQRLQSCERMGREVLSEAGMEKLGSRYKLIKTVKCNGNIEDPEKNSKWNHSVSPATEGEVLRRQLHHHVHSSYSDELSGGSK